MFVRSTGVMRLALVLGAEIAARVNNLWLVGVSVTNLPDALQRFPLDALQLKALLGELPGTKAFVGPQLVLPSHSVGAVLNCFSVNIRSADACNPGRINIAGTSASVNIVETASPPTTTLPIPR